MKRNKQNSPDDDSNATPPDGPTESELQFARNLLEFWRTNPKALHKFQQAIFMGSRVEVPEPPSYRGPMWRLHKYASDAEYWAHEMRSKLTVENMDAPDLRVMIEAYLRLVRGLGNMARVGPRVDELLEQLASVEVRMSEPLECLGLPTPPRRPQ